MAKRGTGGSGLNMTARLDTTQAIKNAQDYIRVLKQVTEAAGIAPNTTPSSNFTKANIQMTKALRDSLLETERLRQENIALQNQWQKGAISLQDLTISQKANTAARQAEIRAAKEARKAQEEVNGSYFAAQARLKALGIEIKSEADGMRKLTPALKSKVREYNELNTALTKFDEKLGNHQRKVGKYENALNGLKGIAASYLGFSAIISGVGAVISTNAEISDSLADVRRTAGLTAVEAENLAEQLKKLDTRTSLKGLLDISVIGGQLGIAKDQLAGFTAAVDQLAVSLSGELQGGAEGIAKSLGVLDNVFGVTKSNAGDVEKSFNQIGSAILGLGQSGLATGDFLTDFGERVGGLAKQAGISLPVILSYGAVLQESGVSAEVAGTSFKRLLSALSTNREKFFAVAQLADANLTMKGFTDTINTDTKKALDLFFAGLQKGGTTTTSFNDILKSLKLTGAGVSQTVAALSGHQESLNGHIEQATKDFNDATLSAEQFALKNDNLAGSVDKLGNAFTNAVSKGSIAAFFKSIIDGLTAGIVKFDKFVNSSSWKEFKARLLDADGGDSFEIRNSFSKNLGKTNANQQFLYPAGGDDQSLEKKLKDRGEVFNAQYLSNLKKTMDEAAELTKKYEDGVKSGKLKENEVTIKDYKSNYEKAKTYYNDVLSLQRKLGFGQKSNVAIKTPPIEVDLGSSKEKKAMDSALKAQRTLQAEIDSLNEKGKRKQLDNDAEEIANVEAKYKKLRDKALAFNNDSTNKKKGLRVDAGGLIVGESKELDSLRDKQAADKLKVSLDEQKKLYDEYESYKEKVGLEKANERYAKLVDTDRTFLEKLEAQRLEITDPQKSKGGVEADIQGSEERLKVLDKEIAAEKLAVQKKNDEIYADAYRSALTHSQELAGIEADFQRKRVALGQSATAEQLTNLNRERDERIRSANEANAFAKSGYADLMMQYDELTRGEIRRRLEAMKESYRQQYIDGKITAEQLSGFIKQINSDIDNINGNSSFNKIAESVKRYREQVKLLGEDSAGAKESQEDMYAAIADGAADVSSVIGELAGSFEQLGIGGEGLQDTLKSVTGVVDGIGGIAKGLATGNPVDIVTGSIKLLTSAIELFNFKDKKLEKQIKGYQAQLDSLGKAYKQLEKDVQNAVGESIYSDQAAQIENLQRQQAELIKMRDAENAKKKTDQNKVNEFQNQIDAIPGQIDDINKAISQNLIQGTFRDLSNSLSDAFAEAFKSGEDGIEKMDEVFNNFIANAIKNSLKLKILDPVVKKFTDELTDFAKTNNNSIVGFDFDKWREQLKEAGELFNAGLKGSEEFFKDITPGASTTDQTALKPNTLTASVNQPTAERLEGLWRGNFDLTKQLVVLAQTSGLTMGDMLQIGKSKLAALERIAVSTETTAGHTARLEAIEIALVSIDKNTKPVKSARD